MKRDPFLELSVTDQGLYIQQAALNSEKSTIIFEKDFWVCWLLKHLLNMPGLGEQLTFKGGTSLSKVYGVIERMSEDIDLSFHRSFLGFDGDNDPEFASSSNERNRRLEQLQQSCTELIREKVFPHLKESIAQELEGSWLLEIDKRDPQTIYFTYPAVIESLSATYIKPVVKVEFGSRSDNWPQETKTVTSYLSEVYPDILSEAGKIDVKVLTIARTFWEKATILHAEFHRSEQERIPSRYSRHYYDLFQISQSKHIKQILTDLSLLSRVAEHKMVFFRSKRANYESAKQGSLRLFPQINHHNDLRSDYEEMRPMFFAAPPKFDEILEGIRDLENEINSQK
jgi:predicted nucleotidyltransferase component of viral defense system